MNVYDLLTKWPSWEKAGAEFIFDSPAWTMPVRWGDVSCILRRADVKPRDVIGIGVRFGDEENVICLANRETFPDLHVLWDQKQQLPPPLILALIEKECGKLLQILENAARRQLSVTGIVSPEKREGCTGFEIVDGEGRIIASFLMKMTSELIHSMGMIKFININHPAISDMEREAFIEYAAISLSQEQFQSLAVGDFLLLPELTQQQPQWQLEQAIDNRIHVCGYETAPLKFGEIVSGKMPPCPTSTSLSLYFQGKRVINGRLDALVGQPAFVIEEIL